MALTKYKLGQLIFETNRQNTNRELGIEFVRGISNAKTITMTKADVSEDVISKFLIVNPGEFVYNPRTTRMGDKVGMGFNNTETPLLFTFNNISFAIKPEAKDTILPEYLFLFYNRSEFDRYAIVNSWGSATELFTFAEMRDIDIELPDLPTQQKYVDIYLSMVANQESYERGLEDLKLTFNAIIDREKATARKMAVGDILREVDNRNSDGAITSVQGINIFKQFMPSIADTTGVSLTNYKLVQNGQFAFSGMQTGRDECIRIALYTGEKPIIISPAYSVFQMNCDAVLPEYLMMWFSRKESDRRGAFMSDGSIRSNLDLDRFYETKIPVPKMDIQNALVELYSAYLARREINEKLKTQIKDICPILIKGSMEKGRK